MFNWQWIHKKWSVRTLEYNVAMKREDALVHATAWVNPENSILKERSQSQKCIFCMTPCKLNVQKRQIYPERQKVNEWLPGAGAAGGNWESLQMGRRLLFGALEMF